MGLPTRAGLREIAQQSEARTRATFRRTKRTDAQYDNRMSTRRRIVPTCKSNLIYRHGKRSKIVIDLQFMRHGVKRWITRYVRIHRYRCRSCRSTFYAPDPRWPTGKYGPALAAYTVYQNIELRLPQSRIAVERKTIVRSLHHLETQLTNSRPRRHKTTQAPMTIS